MKKIALICGLMCLPAVAQAETPTWNGPSPTAWLQCLATATDLYATFDEPADILIRGALAECAADERNYIDALPATGSEQLAADARRYAEQFVTKRMLKARAAARGKPLTKQ